MAQAIAPDGLSAEVLTQIYGEEDWEATIRKVEDEDEEQLVTESCRTRVVCHRVARVGWQFREATDPQGLEDGAFGAGPIRRRRLPLT